MPEATVTLGDAVDRRLPLVSAVSGRPADGYLGVPVGLGPVDRIMWSVSRRTAGRPVVQLPLTQSEFDRVMRLRRAERSGIVNAVLFVVLGVALARFPVLLPLGLVIGAVSASLAVVSRFSLGRLVPEVRVGEGQVKIGHAHETFVSTVKSGQRRYS